ncbi:SWIM-type domain-containing protein [Citrus sinensis]|uniref:SWIM-type domain-containing protein n=1 Tax=Citrus sinensis TaxID=2711 RepID=A0ACB8M623_CITSI|nr:SWIM-type domain-containing protein [Citrus sinensis]
MDMALKLVKPEGRHFVIHLANKSIRSTMLLSEFRRRPASEQPVIEERSSLVYFNIEAVIDGEVFVVGLAIPEQYSLHKMWTDIRDVCWGHPIRDANGIKVQVMFPWQSEQQVILSDKDLLEACNQLKVKGYNWARFAVTANEDCVSSFSSVVQASNKSANVDQCEATTKVLSKGDNDETGEAATEVLPDLKENETSADKFTQQLNNEADNGNEELHYGYAGFANELDEFEDDYEYEAAVDGSYPDDYDSSHLFGTESDSDKDLDDYESGDDSGDDSEDDFEEQACIRYEKNAGGFEFNSVGGEIVLRPGQLFVSVYEFRKVLKVFAIRNEFRLKKLKNEKTRVTCVCAAVGCTWRIHASLNWNKKSFQIKTHCPDHTCPRVDDNFEASLNWIEATYLHLFKANPDIKISVIAAGLMQKYGIECNNQRLYGAKRKAFELLGQDHKASYSKLFRYMHALLNSNPGSTVSLERDWFGGAEFLIFKRFFICFDSSRRGFFEGCRPMIGVDGCHLKGPYRGVLLTAVSIDANYGIYPLAMCVAETENNDSWQYFMDKLYDQVGCNSGEGLCFISDRQKGVLNALDRIFPLSLKRYCCRHIYANFKQKFLGLLLKKVFWRACRSLNAANFNSHMEELKTINPERGLPIVRMFEEIRRKTMRLIHRRHEAALGWNNELPPVVRRKVIKGREEARSLSIIFGHNETFEILEDVTKIVIVDLLKRKCDCGEWAISGMPCKHALCCIDAKRYNVEDYVHPFLKMAAYIAAYKHQIIPVPDEKMWPLLLHDNL